MTEPNAVLDRFAPQLRWVCDSVQRTYDLLDDDMPDWKQEAKLYVLCYAGIIPWPTKAGRHFGLLNVWESGEVRDIPAMLATQLRLDLHEAVYRSISKTLPTTSLGELIENQEFDLEDPNSEADLYNHEQANRLSRQYPELAMAAIEGMSQEQIAAKQGITDRTVRNRITAQKRSYLTDQLRRANLIVEGDETMGELEEAFTNVSKVRR